MGWVEVTEPMTGTVLTVQDDSPQAKLWGAAADEPIDDLDVQPELPEQGDRGEAPAGNASREAWAEYAGTLGVNVLDEWKRDDIRSHVEQLSDDGEN